MPFWDDDYLEQALDDAMSGAAWGLAIGFVLLGGLVLFVAPVWWMNALGGLGAAVGCLVVRWLADNRPW